MATGVGSTTCGVDAAVEGRLEGGAPDVLSLASDEGHALPLAKVYATLFGGDLKLLSMEGHGTDCYVYISRIEDNVLPT